MSGQAPLESAAAQLAAGGRAAFGPTSCAPAFPRSASSSASRRSSSCSRSAARAEISVNQQIATLGSNRLVITPQSPEHRRACSRSRGRQPPDGRGGATASMGRVPTVAAVSGNGAGHACRSSMATITSSTNLHGAMPGYQAISTRPRPAYGRFFTMDECIARGRGWRCSARRSWTDLFGKDNPIGEIDRDQPRSLHRHRRAALEGLERRRRQRRSSSSCRCKPRCTACWAGSIVDWIDTSAARRQRGG